MGFGKDGKGAIVRSQVAGGALGALGSSDAVAFASITLGEDFRVLKSIVYATIDSLTASEQGLFGLYMCNGALSAAEVEEAIEADGPTDRNDANSRERAERQVHLIGVARKTDAAAVFIQFESPEGGLIMTDKFRWTYSDPEGWLWAIYNMGTGITTGATLQLRATHYGVWVT